MFQRFNYLGFNNPYYFDRKGTFIIKSNLSDLLKEYEGKCIIDPVAVLEILNKNFIFGDRTLIQGIYRTPWLARPNELLNGWDFADAPKHNILDIDEQQIAKTLFKKICDEIQLYVGDNKRVGILLSGGMDSRMVAGALDHLLKTSVLNGVEVTALTWGNEGTRDVIYAKEISNRLNWKWKHYKVTAKDLLNNIKETAIRGCEYSPVHLHAIPQIRDDNTFDVILAGSYGDSIGRSEYSRKKVRFIKPIIHGFSNTGGLVQQNLYNHSIKHIEQDIARYHLQFPETESYMQNELDYQLHYMRRMLNPCMEILNEKMDFCQVFTHPDVVSYMFSIKPEKRNDMVYFYMLQEFTTKLDDIPWARNGIPFGQKKGNPDLYLKDHHSYVSFFHKEIINETESLFLSEEIKQLNIFNEKAIKTLIKMIKLFSLKNPSYTEKLLWLASLALMTRKYNIQGYDNLNYKKAHMNKSPISISAEYLINEMKHKAASFIK